MEGDRIGGVAEHSHRKSGWIVAYWDISKLKLDPKNPRVQSARQIRQIGYSTPDSSSYGEGGLLA